MVNKQMGKNSKAIKKHERKQKKLEEANNTKVPCRGYLKSTKTKESVGSCSDSSSIDESSDEKNMSEFKDALFKLVQSWADECFADENLNPGNEKGKVDIKVSHDLNTIKSKSKIESSILVNRDKQELETKEAMQVDNDYKLSIARMFNFNQTLNHFKELEKMKQETPKEIYLQQRRSSTETLNRSQADALPTSKKDNTPIKSSNLRVEECLKCRMFNYSIIKTCWSNKK